MTCANEMTQIASSTTDKIARLGCNDPLLQELWAIKATMNAESGYSIQTLAEQARQFNLEETLTRLRQLVGH